MNLFIYKNKALLIQALADFLSHAILEQVETGGSCSIVLSGGNTPKALYEQLAKEPYLSRIPWKDLFFFWGDERYVPFDSDRNNAKMAYAALLDKVPVDAEKIFRIDTSLPFEASIARYDEILHRHFPTRTGADIVLLGLGDNAHTLSLFPGEAGWLDYPGWVDGFQVEAEQEYRISLMPAFVNRGSSLIFLVEGASKAMAVHQILEEKYDPLTYPGQIIQPVDGQLFWFLDEGSASGLSTYNPDPETN